MTQTLRPQPGILDIALYVGGESRLAGHAEVLKLSSNEETLTGLRRARRGLPGRRRAIAPLSLDRSSWLRVAIGRGARPRPRPHHLRRGFGRGAPDGRAGLCRPRRRGSPDRARLLDVPDPRENGRRDAGHRDGAGKDRGRDAILAAVTERTRIVFIANPRTLRGRCSAATSFSGSPRGCPTRAPRP